MFRPLIATAATGLFALTISVCEASTPIKNLGVDVGDSVSSLVAANGQPSAKRIVNTEESPIKGELWVYADEDSDHEFLVRDGKICWTGDVPHRRARAEETRIAGE